ncbi:hypothetical protein FRB90_010702 [Tulasnella sp. 427]|nr:hypothetical protein FRB90_010702 [Tulasnella sp. 427]
MQVSWKLSFVLETLRLWKEAKKGKTTRKEPLDQQANSKLIQVAQDVLLLILHHLDNCALISLMQTCQQFQVSLEPILYRHIVFPLSSTYFREKIFFQTLVNRQDNLLPLIWTYHGPLTPLEFSVGRKPSGGFDKIFRKRRGPRKPPPAYKTPWFDMAVTIFAGANNIVDLQLHDTRPWSYGEAFNPTARGISNMTLRRLKVLRSPELLHVLRDTSTLGQVDFHEECFFRLALSTKPITDLSVDLDAVVGICETVRMIGRALKDVENLTLLARGGLYGRVILDEIPAFKSLKSLALEDACLTDHPSTPVEGSPSVIRLRPSSSDWDELFEELKGLCPSLTSTNGHHSPCCESVGPCATPSALLPSIFNPSSSPMFAHSQTYDSYPLSI